MLNGTTGQITGTYTGPYISEIDCKAFGEKVLNLTKKDEDLKKHKITMMCISRMEI
jgi:hypothetical protein